MEEKKELIQDTFQKHFNHFGFTKTTVDEVAEELKISKKTIYKFFKSKEEIFYSIVKKIAHGYCRNMEKKLEKYPGWKEKIGELVRLIFVESKKWLKNNDAFEFRYKQDIASLAFKDAYAELFLKLLKTGSEMNELSVRTPELALMFIQGLISESQKSLSADLESVNEEDVIESIRKIL